MPADSVKMSTTTQDKCLLSARTDIPGQPLSVPNTYITRVSSLEGGCHLNTIFLSQHTPNLISPEPDLHLPLVPSNPPRHEVVSKEHESCAGALLGYVSVTVIIFFEHGW